MDTQNLISQLYSRAQTTMPPAPVAPKEAVAGPDFAEIARGIVDDLRRNEAVAQAGLAGRAEPQSVVMALASTELAIETAVTLRDRVVEAYQEILRMPV
ncbi:flagellar hook-basal body protein FliE (plasmid) [Paroceanicella profunda]|uniref:Flagellar hook-basal body protein FliE n=1 Tax=Paroceanicella profunda TaxID=2579971 RepID=A0A5B8G5N1_9RHOB|nr:flagellar hook-basal body complex protein FliE [Paroceanicella profunda]QDL94779.1 flagellar hook-basal body protein FliE [Paroceanicella profunda]